MLEVLGSVSMKPEDFREFMDLVKPSVDGDNVSYWSVRQSVCRLLRLVQLVVQVDWLGLSVCWVGLLGWLVMLVGEVDWLGLFGQVSW